MRSRTLDIDDRTQDLAELLRGEPGIGQEFARLYELSWIHHDCALEGVIYTAQEIATALAGQPLAEVGTIALFRDIRNARAAVDLVRAEARQKKVKITLALVRQLNATLHAGNEARAGAEFRKDIPLHRAYFHDIAQPGRIVPLLQKLFDSCETADFRNAHPIQQATRLHHGYMQVFPYTENSGRVARLFMNLVLLHAGFQLPVIIHATDRQRYYESLRLPEVTLRDLTLEALDNALSQAEKLFAQAPVRARKAAR
jgi:Fic family protein